MGQGTLDGVDPVWLQAAVFLARRSKQPLELAARKQLYECVNEYPGLHLSEIGRRVEMDTNHAKYHLEVLERHDLISSKKEEGYWRFYPKKEGQLGPQEILQPEEKQWLSLLRRRVPLQATLVLLDEGEASLGDIADALGIAASTMHYHAGKMEDAGLVTSRKDGRKRIYELADPQRAAELVVTYEPPDELVGGFLEAFEELDFP